MVSETQENNPDTINNDLDIRENLKLALDRIAETEGFTNYSIDISSGSNVGDGFVAIILKIKIFGVRRRPIENGIRITNNDKIILIAKVPPYNQARREFGDKLFKREVYVYNNVLPIFTKFQIDKCIREEERFTSFPKYYLADYTSETMDAYIIMEDLREQGFKLQSKFITVDLPFVEVWAKSLAKFHAISFAMRDQCPEQFKRFHDLNDTMCDAMDAMFSGPLLKEICDKGLTTLNDDEQIIKDKFLNFKNNLTNDLIKKITDGNTSEPYSVVNHGDCWINNVMFKFQDRNPKYIRLLDWQLCRYGSPVLDIAYFIFACTDGKFRERYYDSVIQLYHKSLRDYVEQLGSDVSKLFPFTALLRQLKEFGKFGLIIGLIITPMLCTESNELPDANNLAEMSQDVEKANELNSFFQVSKKAEEKYRQRMGDIIRDMVRLGYI